MDEMFKQKVITFLSLYSTNVGQNGLRTNDPEVMIVPRGLEQATFDQVDRIFAHFQEDIFDEEIRKPENRYVDEPRVADQYQGNGEEIKPRKAFTTKDGKTFYPATCRSCGQPAYSVIEGQDPKNCKACRV